MPDSRFHGGTMAPRTCTQYTHTQRETEAVNSRHLDKIHKGQHAVEPLPRLRGEYMALNLSWGRSF